MSDDKRQYVIVHFIYGNRVRLFGPFASEEEAKASPDMQWMRATQDVKIVKLG